MVSLFLKLGCATMFLATIAFAIIMALLSLFLDEDTAGLISVIVVWTIIFALSIRGIKKLRQNDNNEDTV